MNTDRAKERVKSKKEKGKRKTTAPLATDSRG
jgi:hypothetical protein